jgi:hypothetical protein
MIVEKQINVAISIASSGDNTIIAAPTQGYIAIDNINFVPASAVSVKLIRGTTDLTGVYSLTANQGFTQENAVGHQDGIITCLPGEAFKINLSGAVQVSGFCKYRIIGN